MEPAGHQAVQLDEGSFAVQVLLLGPLEVRAGKDSLPLGGTKQRAVLAMLTLQLNQVVPMEFLIDGIWGDVPVGNAPNAVQVYVSQLRKLLTTNPASGVGGVLQRRAPGYVFQLDPASVDLRRFELL